MSPDFLFAPAAASNPFQQAKLALIAKIARLPVPRIDVTPMPEQFEAAVDFVAGFANAGDEFMQAVGAEIRTNSITGCDLSLFERPFTDAVEGFALHEIAEIAEATRSEYAEAVA